MILGGGDEAVEFVDIVFADVDIVDLIEIDVFWIGLAAEFHLLIFKTHYL